MDNPEVGLVVAKVISSLTDLALGESPPFEMVVDDPSGNSFVENLCAPSPDPQLSVKHYSRTAQQVGASALKAVAPAEENATQPAATRKHSKGESKGKTKDKGRKSKGKKDKGKSSKSKAETRKEASPSPARQAPAGPARSVLLSPSPKRPEKPDKTKKLTRSQRRARAAAWDSLAADGEN